MSPGRASARWAGWRIVAIACAALVLAVLAAVHVLLRGSLPQLDGEVASAGLAAPVTINRDRLGVATITAANRTDLAYGTGFAHAQDRFFEMDISRRLAAGELSELVGRLTLEQDTAARLFQFRAVAQEVIRQATPAQRAILEAYARGVNAGLAGLRARPWEYLVLGARPVPWKPEDSILVVHAMWWQLQYLGFHREIMRREVNERLGGALCGPEWKCALSFFYPPRTAWDAPAVGPAEPATPPLPIPTSDIIDVRGATPAASAAHVATAATALGSNNWAVAGALTSTGAALVANDMHLGQRVPIVWYHARLRMPASSGAAGLDITGVTLPGAPLVVAGSNGHIAWGFTNSYGNWLGVSLVPCSGAGEKQLQTAAGPVELHVQWETIHVHGEADVRLPVRSGPGGVLLEAHPDRQQCWFGSWLAQRPSATNLNLIELERVTSTQAALALAPTIGIPHQNAVVGDRDGHIGWSIFGRIPVDTGPQRSAEDSGWTDRLSQPHLLDPPSGRLWSANARVTSDPQQERAIGADTASLGSEYDLGARAAQIRDGLQALRGAATPADMLRIQLDDRAVFLTRWHDLLLGLLDAQAVQGRPQRAELRRLVASWDGAAATGSIGYRVVRTWRDQVEVAVWDMILDGLHIQADESYGPPTQFEEPLWRLVNDRPLHLLSARYAAWRDLLLAQVDATGVQLSAACTELARCTWGRRNFIRIRHPLSGAFPSILSQALDMPAVELPGDIDMPRVQGQAFGASERFAVSPGHEEQGYFHMPGGQSGQPLSPYYRAGFMEWARGQPLPFLPGPTQHTLTLNPP